MRCVEELVVGMLVNVVDSSSMLVVDDEEDLLELCILGVIDH